MKTEPFAQPSEPPPAARHPLPDSGEEIHPVQIAIYRRMTVGQKLDALSQMYRMGRWMLRSQVREKHPDWDEPTVEREVSRRFANGAS